MKHTRAVALCGVLSALAIVLMILGSLLGLGTYAAPLLAGLVLLPAGQKLGRKFHALLWLSVSLLSFLLVPDPEQNLMFFGLFGCYPILRPLMQRLPKIPRMIVKFLYFNLTVIVLEALLMLFIAPAAEEIGFLMLLLALGNLTFFCYDLLLQRAQGMIDRFLGRFLRF